MQVHLEHCTGGPRVHQCECSETFANRKDKHRHRLRCEVAQGIIDEQHAARVQLENSNNTNSNNTNSNNTTTVTDNSVDNSTNVNIENLVINLPAPAAPAVPAPPAAPVAVNDFADTNIQTVIDDILRNPAPIQVAHKKGVLHEAMLSVMHYTGSEENHNVYGIEMKGRSLHVRQRGRRRAIDKTKALDSIFKRVQTVSNSPLIRALLMGNNTTDLPVTVPTTLRERKQIESMYQFMIQYKGEGHPTFEALIYPKELAPPIDVVAWGNCVIKILKDLKSSYQLDPEEFKEATMLASWDYRFMDEMWFSSNGTGWELCDGPAVIQSKMHVKLNDLKNALLQRLMSEAGDKQGDAVSFTESQLESRRLGQIVPRLPDLELAKRSIEWIKDRESAASTDITTSG